MIKVPHNPIRVALAAASLALLGVLTTNVQAQTESVTVTQAEITAGLNAFDSTNSVTSLSVALGSNQLTLNAALSYNGQTLATVSTWVPSLSQGQLTWALTSATANGKTASSSTLNTLNTYRDDLRTVVTATLQGADYAYPTWLVQSYSLTSSALSVTVNKNTNGTPMPTLTKTTATPSSTSNVKTGKSAKAVDIPVAGLNSTDSDAVTNAFSQNWAGYVVLTDVNAQKRLAQGDLRMVTGQWMIPALACGTTDSQSSIWVGLDGYGDPTVEQAGTSQDCVSGVATYSAWFEVFPRPDHETANLTVQAGDQVSSTIQFDGKQAFTLTLKDITSGQQAVETRTVPLAGRRSAEWIVEAPMTTQQIVPLADFDTVQFSSISLTEAAQTGSITDSAWHSKVVIMADTDGTLKAQPSPISTDGASFDVSWLAAN